MTITEYMVLGAVIGTAALVAGFIEAKVIKRHNARLIEDVHAHVASSSLAISDAVRDVAAMVEKAASDAKNAAAEEAKKS